MALTKRRRSLVPLLGGHTVRGLTIGYLLVAGQLITPTATASPPVRPALSATPPNRGPESVVTPCPGDCADGGDGVVDTTDMLALLGDWGEPGACDFDDSGVVDTADILTLLSNWGPCPTCGEGEGSCFEPHATTGCDDRDCCTTVCTLDPFCCTVEWDGLCVNQALQNCAGAQGACCFLDGTCVDGLTSEECAAIGGVFQEGGTECGDAECPDLLGACCLPDGNCAELEEEDCAAAFGYFHGVSVSCADVECSFEACPNTGSCFSVNGTPGCSSQTCCNFVCSIDPLCCSTWDAGCVTLALEICGQCGAPDSGGCFAANGSVGCSDSTCCAIVCAVDPFCCNTQWDSLCVNGAVQLCNQLDCEDDNACQTGDQVLAFLSNGVTFVQADNFVIDAPDDVVVDSLCWSGVYFDDIDCGPAPDAFLVNYYEDDGSGLPGPLVASFSQTDGTLVVSSPVPTGAIVANIAAEFRHDASHANLLLSPGVCYWVEVINTGPVEPCKWFWESSSDGDGQSAQSTSDGPWEHRTRDYAFCLNVPLFGSPACPCTLECPPDALSEDEVCGDDTNGGCNVVPPIFTPMSIGSSICGTTWADGGVRDTDWFLVTHPGGALTATLTSEIPMVCFLAEFVGNCPVQQVGATGCADACVNISQAIANVPAGNYLVVVVPGLCNQGGIFDGFPCEQSHDYVLEVTAPPPTPTGQCCFPAGTCQVRTEADCAFFGGTYGGDGTDCLTGACCLLDGTCIDTTAGGCLFSGGTFIGGCTSCADGDCDP